MPWRSGPGFEAERTGTATDDSTAEVGWWPSGTSAVRERPGTISPVGDSTFRVAFIAYVIGDTRLAECAGRVHGRAGGSVARLCLFGGVLPHPPLTDQHGFR